MLSYRIMITTNAWNCASKGLRKYLSTLCTSAWKIACCLKHLYNCLCFANVSVWPMPAHNYTEICINTIGSFTCECDDDYELDSDMVKCNGMYKMCIYMYLHL